MNVTEFTGPDSYLRYCLFIATLWSVHGEFAITLQDFYSACVPVKGNMTQKCKQQVYMMGKSGPALKGLSRILWNGTTTERIWLDLGSSNIRALQNERFCAAGSTSVQQHVWVWKHHRYSGKSRYCGRSHFTPWATAVAQKSSWEHPGGENKWFSPHQLFFYVCAGASYTNSYSMLPCPPWWWQHLADLEQPWHDLGMNKHDLSVLLTRAPLGCISQKEGNQFTYTFLLLLLPWKWERKNYSGFIY